MSTEENVAGLGDVLGVHEWQPTTEPYGWCACGESHSRTTHRAHVADMLAQVTEAREAELRAEIGRQIRATAADPERRRPLAPDAECPTDFANDFEWAARIAEGGE